MKLVDLSATIENISVSPIDQIQIDYLDHANGARQAQGLVGLPPELLRNGEGWAVENIKQLNTHGTTHIDAPWHYNSVIQGKPAATVDQLPLEWFFADAVKLDMRHKPDGEPMTTSEAKTALDAASHTLKPLDIVLVQCGCDQYLGKPEYMTHGCGATGECTRWLFDQGVRVMGIDAWGWDRPLHLQAQEAIAKNLPGIFWEAHQCDLPYSQIERLVNLDKLPATGFKIMCFPLKIKAASAAPARVIALLDA